MSFLNGLTNLLLKIFKFFRNCSMEEVEISQLGQFSGLGGCRIPVRNIDMGFRALDDDRIAPSLARDFISIPRSRFALAFLTRLSHLASLASTLGNFFQYGSQAREWAAQRG